MSKTNLLGKQMWSPMDRKIESHISSQCIQIVWPEITKLSSFNKAKIQSVAIQDINKFLPWWIPGQKQPLPQNLVLGFQPKEAQPSETKTIRKLDQEIEFTAEHSCSWDEIERKLLTEALTAKLLAECEPREREIERGVHGRRRPLKDLGNVRVWDWGLENEEAAREVDLAEEKALGVEEMRAVEAAMNSW